MQSIAQKVSVLVTGVRVDCTGNGVFQFALLSFRGQAMAVFRSPRRLKVFFDGGCRPNPGPIEAAVVLRGVTHQFGDLGSGTSSDAEWQALICAMRLAQTQGLADFDLVGDAIGVVDQARAALRDRRAIHQHAAAFLALAEHVPGLRIKWIKRQQNLAGIALAARHPR